MMRVLRLRCILVGIAVATLFSATVSAQGTDWKDPLETLEAKLFFVRKLVEKYPVSGFAETWSLLEVDARALKDAHGGIDDIAGVHRAVLLSWGLSLQARNRDVAALERFKTLVAEYDVGASGFRKAAAAAAAIHLDMAESATADVAKLEQYLHARKYFERIGDDRSAAGIRDRIIDLECREGIRLYDERKYVEAFELLAGVEAREGTLGTGEANDALRAIREKTGVLSIRLVDVSAPGTEVTEVGRLVLTPRGGGEKLETGLSESVRWLNGEYDVGLVLPGSDRPAITSRIVLGPSGAEVEFPKRFPPGMVYVPAGKVFVPSGMKYGATAGEVRRPFFIDRVEVTVEDYRAFDPGYKPRYAGKNYPAHEISHEKARAYAVSVGKKLPTWAQWNRAAFGGMKRRYPWGESVPTGRTNIGTRQPSAVDSYPAGASTFSGALNMAGNVWEWLRDGYAIGGGFRNGFLEYDVGGWKADFLREPKPGAKTYSAPEFIRQQKQRQYRIYKVTDKNLQEVGIRCVIEL